MWKWLKSLSPVSYRHLTALTGTTIALESKRQREYVPGWPSPEYSLALLYYKPEKRLSISVGLPNWSRNFRLYGPKKLSFEK